MGEQKFVHDTPLPSLDANQPSTANLSATSDEGDAMSRQLELSEFKHITGDVSRARAIVLRVADETDGLLRKIARRMLLQLAG